MQSSCEPLVCQYQTWQQNHLGTLFPVINLDSIRHLSHHPDFKIQKKWHMSMLQSIKCSLHQVKDLDLSCF